LVRNTRINFLDIVLPSIIFVFNLLQAATVCAKDKIGGRPVKEKSGIEKETVK
jgi:hypothetical protein